MWNNLTYLFQVLFNNFDWFSWYVKQLWTSIIPTSFRHVLTHQPCGPPRLLPEGTSPAYIYSSFHLKRCSTTVEVNFPIFQRISLYFCSLATKAVYSYKNQNSKKKFRHLHGDLNLDEIKNALWLLSVNGETNLMNLIRL